MERPTGAALAPTAPSRRRRRLRSLVRTVPVLLAVTVGIVAGVRLTQVETARHSFPLASVVRPPGPGASYWGIYRPGVPADPDRLLALEADVGRRPAIVMTFQSWIDEPSFPASDAAWMYERGIVPMITWEPWEPRAGVSDTIVDQPRYRLDNVVAGAFDDYLRRYAGEVRRFGGPVMLRPFHEMDGNWYPWGGTVNGNTPEDTVAAWRHVHDLFEEAGATNVTWVWSVNHISIPVREDLTIDRFWPGEEYVDWVGISGFNWGMYRGRNVWQTFDEVNGDRYRELLAFDKPVAVTEMGAPEIGGDKVEWILSTYRDFHARYPRIGAVIWYDGATRVDGTLVRDYRIDSSPEALLAFRTAIDDPFILSAREAQERASAD